MTVRAWLMINGIIFLGTKIPHTQQLIADILNLPTPEQIVFAPNTHEFSAMCLSVVSLA
ncbi:hypothetical protein [Alishewanella longhuensis]